MTTIKTLQQLRDGFQGAGCDDEVKALTKAIKALELVERIASRRHMPTWREDYCSSCDTDIYDAQELLGGE